MDGFGGRRRQWHMKPLPVGPQYILYTSPTQYIYCIQIQIQKNNRTVYSVIHLQSLQKVPHCAVALWWNENWSQCNVHENQYEYKLCSRVLWISLFFCKRLQSVARYDPEKVKRREPYIKMQIKLLLYNSHCVSTTVSFNMECTLTRYIQTSTAFIFESALSWEPSSQSICNVSVEEWIFKVVSGQNLRGRKSSFRDRAQNCLRPEPPSEKSPQPHLNHYVHL